MFRTFDVLVLISAILSLTLSVYLFVFSDKYIALYVGIWVPSVLGFGIYVKLLRIVHFVLYKNLKDEAMEDVDNG